MNSSKYFYGMLFLLIVIRFFHLGKLIDQPHDWRQCDTAYYIQDFHENGIDLLYPAVCWMGNSDTLALEFPLPEGIVAAGYNIFGESIPLSRIFFLTFFLGAVFYFYKIVRLLTNNHVARIATVAYMMLPLSIYYSRAVHIDFSVVFLSHAMFYYFLLGINRIDRWYVLLSSICAALAFLIKVPYVFYWSVPMLIFAVNKKVFRWVLPYTGFYLIGLFIFLWWQWHVSNINGKSPDWDYILHYHKMIQNSGWYFGSIQQRLSLYPWWVLLQRGVLEVTGIGGIIFLVAGITNIRKLASYPVIAGWIVAVIIYTLIFFNLNFIHNYYQIPLLAPAAFLIARGIQLLEEKWNLRVPVSLGVLFVVNLCYCELSYYTIDPVKEEVAGLIRDNTPEHALIIVTYKTMDCRDPGILYRSRRKGWSIEEAALNKEVLRRLSKEEGAQYWVHLTGQDQNKLSYDFDPNLKAIQEFQLHTTTDRLFIYQWVDK